MQNLVCYKTMPEWDAHSVPKGFRNRHNTKVGTWAKLTISSGKMKYYLLDENDNVLDTVIFTADSDIPFIEPQVWHKVEPLGDDLRCQLAFYCKPEDYYVKKYGLTAVHSEVLDAVQYISSGKALDLGCGRGRNALYLRHCGFDVTAFDANTSAIQDLQAIIADEKLDKIKAYVANIHDADWGGDYDLIVNTVVLMFLSTHKIPEVITKMQTSTRSGGYNVVVCAMDTEDYPMSAHRLPFRFGFKSGELRNYYRDWEIKKYNENVGHLHRRDSSGNQIALRFATLIARKK
ncbi:MAG: tellurite resistance methyltransferase TehB [Gammaproteobacteria bacterium]|nr:MAG: tellurite resistance methyltransferase TehB [Gammaproteobacteria bacterium]